MVLFQKCASRDATAILRSNVYVHCDIFLRFSNVYRVQPYIHVAANHCNRCNAMGRARVRVRACANSLCACKITPRVKAISAVNFDFFGIQGRRRLYFNAWVFGLWLCEAVCWSLVCFSIVLGVMGSSPLSANGDGTLGKTQQVFLKTRCV